MLILFALTSCPKVCASFDQKGDSRVERCAFGGNVSGGRGRDATTHVRAIQFGRRFIKLRVCQNGEHPAHVEPVRETPVADILSRPHHSSHKSQSTLMPNSRDKIYCLLVRVHKNLISSPAGGKEKAMPMYERSLVVRVLASFPSLPPP
jgi:hypothetical protein